MPTLLLPFAPEPHSQRAEDDEGHGAGPERYVVAACRHSNSEEDAKQLRKGDEPENDHSNKRRGLLHLSTLPSSDTVSPPTRREPWLREHTLGSGPQGSCPRV